MAARYRIGVDELVSAGSVDVDIGEHASTWLAAVPKGEGAIYRLCSISRLPKHERMQMLTGKLLRTAVFPLLLPLLDVEPLGSRVAVLAAAMDDGWRRWCDHPASEVENVTPGMLSKARNMRRLLKALERKRYRRVAGRSL